MAKAPRKGVAATPPVEAEDDGPSPHASAAPANNDSNQPWRKRADEYDSAYKGPPHWVRAINVIAATGSLPLALREANVARAAFNKRRERYPEFAEAIDEANQYFREVSLEQTASMRAIDGTLKDVYHKGAVVGQERIYSDTLMVKLLEANSPEKFKPKVDVSNTIEVEITGGLPTTPRERDPNLPSEGSVVRNPAQERRDEAARIAAAEPPKT